MNERTRSGASLPPPAALIGRVLDDRYRIDAVIARGGMGCVYRATVLPVGEPCALKVVTKADLSADEDDFEARFVREATTTARLRHPYCVSVLDFGETEDRILYLAMELLTGTTVADALRTQGPFPLARFVRVAQQVCEGVAAAHDLGIVHRDLKTANIFLCRRWDGDDDVKVLDFGIAKRLHDTSVALTRPGQMLGTPKYMAPEQILGKAIDTRADVYSLGIVFFEMLTGRVPFDGDNFLDVLAGHAREPVPLMAAVNPEVTVPAELEATVQRMLAKEPADRFANLREVIPILVSLEVAPGEGPRRNSTPHDLSPYRRPSLPPSASDRDAPTRISRMPLLTDRGVRPEPQPPNDTGAPRGRSSDASSRPRTAAGHAGPVSDGTSRLPESATATLRPDARRGPFLGLVIGLALALAVGTFAAVDCARRPDDPSVRPAASNH